MREIVLGLVSTVSEGACLCFVHDGSTHSLAARRLNVIIPRLWRHCEVLCLGTGWIWWCDLDRSCLRERAKCRHRERQGCTWTPETVGNLVLACFPGSKAVFATHTAVVSRGKRRGKVQGSGIWGSAGSHLALCGHRATVTSSARMHQLAQRRWRILDAKCLLRSASYSRLAGIPKRLPLPPS